MFVDSYRVPIYIFGISYHHRIVISKGQNPFNLCELQETRVTASHSSTTYNSAQKSLKGAR